MLFIRELRETLGRFPCNRGPDGRAAAAAAVAAGGLAVVLAVTVLVEIVAGSADAASPVT